MATRGRTTFQKRQKEMARKEKQRMKAERRAQRKAAGGLMEPEDQFGEAIQPLGPEEQFSETSQPPPAKETGESA